MSIPAYKTWILEVQAVLWSLQLCLKRSFWLDGRLQPKLPTFALWRWKWTTLFCHPIIRHDVNCWPPHAFHFFLLTIFLLPICTSSGTCEVTRVILKTVSRLIGRTEFEWMLSIKWNISVRSLLVGAGLLLVQNVLWMVPSCLSHQRWGL